MSLKKQIVFVSYHYWPPSFGGELLISIERFHGLVARGFAVTVLTSGGPELSSRQLDRGIAIHRSPAIGGSRLARLLRRFVYVLWAFCFLLQTEFDIYYQGDTAGVDHLTSAFFVWLLTRVARWKQARTVIVHSLALSEHATFDLRGWVGFWRRVLFGCFDSIVAVSPGLYADLKLVFPKSARLIVNGVRDDLFSPLPAQTRSFFRDAQGVAEDQVVFAFLGTVGYRKGFDVLAQAFANLSPKYPHWRLWVIGPYTVQHSQNLDPAEVRIVTSALDGVNQRVKYWGRIDEREKLNDILSASDIFVFPSRREGMGLAPVEAMAAGVPVIIARIPGVTDLANIEGETGFYVPVGNVVSLQTVMEKLGNDSVLRRSMGQKAAKRVHDSFGWQDHLSQWEALYLKESTRS